VAVVFEATGVGRTEQNIINWCQPNRQGISRLDSYFDPDEQNYYLTPQSVGRVIQEKIQRATKKCKRHGRKLPERAGKRRKINRL